MLPLPTHKCCYVLPGILTASQNYPSFSPLSPLYMFSLECIPHHLCLFHLYPRSNSKFTSFKKPSVIAQRDTIIPSPNYHDSL